MEKEVARNKLGKRFQKAYEALFEERSAIILRCAREAELHCDCVMLLYDLSLAEFLITQPSESSFIILQSFKNVAKGRRSCSRTFAGTFASTFAGTFARILAEKPFTSR